MSEINYIEEIPEGTFPMDLKFIQNFLRQEHSIIDKDKMVRTISFFVEVLILILNL